MPRIPDPEHVFLAWIDFMFNDVHKSLRRAYDVADETRFGPSTERGVERDANVRR